MSYWSRNSFRVAVPGQDSYWYMINLLISVLQTIFLIRSLYAKSQIIALTSNATIWWALQTQPWLSQPEYTIWPSRHRTLRNQYLYLGVFLWKQYIILASYEDFCEMQSFLLCTPLLTLTYCLFQSHSNS